MGCQGAGLKGLAALFAAGGAGLVVGCLCGTGGIGGLVLGLYNILEVMSMGQLRFDHITADSTLHGILLSSAADMVGSMCLQIQNRAATALRANLPVVIGIALVAFAGSMDTGLNYCAVRSYRTAALPHCIAGITVDLVLVIRGNIAFQLGSAGVTCSILLALKGVRGVVFHLAASTAGEEVNSLSGAGAGRLQRLCLLLRCCIIMSSKAAVRSTAQRTNSQVGTGCGSPGVISGEGAKGLGGDLAALAIKKLTAVIAFRMLIPTLGNTGGLLGGNGSHFRMGAANSDSTLGSKAAVIGGNGDHSSTGTHSSHQTGSIHSSNGGGAGSKDDRLVSSVRRSHGGSQLRSLALGQSQSGGVQSDTGNSYRRTLDFDSTVDHIKMHIVFIAVVHIIRIIGQLHRVTAGSGFCLNLEGQHSQQPVTTDIQEAAFNATDIHRGVGKLFRGAGNKAHAVAIASFNSRQGHGSSVISNVHCEGGDTGAVFDPDIYFRSLAGIYGNSFCLKGSTAGSIDRQQVQQQCRQNHKRKNLLFH